MANIGYARVSTVEQNLTIQLETLKQAGCSKIFSGIQGGASKQNEEKLNELLSYVRQDDVVIVTKLDRLGRSLKSVLATIEAIHAKKSTLRTLDRAIDTSNSSPIAKATIALLSVFAELERDLIISRTAEGRERARAEGKHLGRPPKVTDEERREINKQLANGVSISAISRKFDLSRTTIRRIKNKGDNG
jgi:DNA invertase Pin-like site-specific DNA recombinase